VFTDLAGSRNAYRLRALAELAKHHEHGARDYARALEITRRALELEDTPELRRRERRLVERVGRAGEARGGAGRRLPLNTSPIASL
jgi:hypothetical protein